MSRAVCTMHGRPLEDHVCLYCCLCFKDLTIAQCHITADGRREDVCEECARAEAELMKSKVDPNK